MKYKDREDYTDLTRQILPPKEVPPTPRSQLPMHFFNDWLPC